MMLLADKISATAASRLRNTWGCGTNATNCANSFLTLAERIFRRPLTDAEKSTYNGFFTKYGAQVGSEIAPCCSYYLSSVLIPL